MSKLGQASCKMLPRIPLNYIDTKKVSIRSLTRVDLVIYKKKLKREINLSLEVDGDAPTFISMIDYDVKQVDKSLYRSLNLKLGDFIFAINGKNVSRASKKSVEKIIKSSDILVMTLYRQKSSKAGPDTMTRQISASETSSHIQKVTKKSLFPSTLKPFFHKFASSFIGCAGKSARVNQTQCYDQQRSSVLTENTHDFGYCSIEKPLNDPLKMSSGDQTWKCLHETNGTRPLTSDSTSYSSGFKSISSHSLEKPGDKNKDAFLDEEMDDHQLAFIQEVESFLVNVQQSISMLVRPTLTFNILSKSQYLDLFQNIEKVSQLSITT